MPHGLLIQTCASDFSRCLDLPDGSSHGTRVHQWDCGNAPYRHQWVLMEAGGGWYRVGLHIPTRMTLDCRAHPHFWLLAKHTPFWTPSFTYVSRFLHVCCAVVCQLHSGSLGFFVVGAQVKRASFQVVPDAVLTGQVRKSEVNWCMAASFMGSIRRADNLGGALQVLSGCAGTTNEHFGFEPVRDGYRLRVRHTYMCIGVVSASSSNGAQLEQQECRDSADQVFKVTALPQGRPGGRFCSTGAALDRSCLSDNVYLSIPPLCHTLHDLAPSR